MICLEKYGYINSRQDEAFKTLKQWKTIVEKQTRKHDKKLRTNNGLEFVYEEFNS